MKRKRTSETWGRGVEAYGTKSLDAISPDFVNSFRWKNNSVGCGGVVTLNPCTASILIERQRYEEHPRTKGADCDRSSGIALPFSLVPRSVPTKGLKLAKGGGHPPLFVLREKIIALLRGTSQGCCDRFPRHANTWLLELHS